MMTRSKQHEDGYSLVELMVVILLTAMLTLGVIGMFVAMVKSNSKSRALAGIKQEGDYITTKMERVIRDGVAASCTGLNDLSVTKLGGSSTISFNSPQILIDGVVVNNEAAYVPDSYQITCIGTDRVLVEFTLRSNAAEVEVPFSVYVYLRNSRNI